MAKKYNSAHDESARVNAPKVQSRRGDIRRKKILRVASRQFLKHGYNGVSINDILLLSGGSKATLYDCFNSKEDLFRAVIVERCNTVTEFLKDIDIKNAELEDILYNFGIIFLNFVCEKDNVRLFQIVLGEAQRFPRLAQDFYHCGPRESYTILSKIFQTKAEMSIHEANIASQYFLDLVRGKMYLELILQVSPSCPKRSVNQHVRSITLFFLRNIKNSF